MVINIYLVEISKRKHSHYSVERAVFNLFLAMAYNTGFRGEICTIQWTLCDPFICAYLYKPMFKPILKKLKLVSGTFQ